MTNLDHLFFGANQSGDSEVVRQTGDLFDALYELDRQHPELPETGTVAVAAGVFGELLKAYRELTA